MAATMHTSNGRLALAAPEPSDAEIDGRTPMLGNDLDLGRAFFGTVLRYSLRVLPQVSSELAHWRAAAAEIPNAQLRRAATEALCKRGNIEGAALFGTLAPAIHRPQTVRALVAFQAAYNYLDALSELPSEDPLANGEQLHQGLLRALHPDAPHLDYYAYSHACEDGGYLTRVLDACRSALAELPSYRAVAPIARAAAARIVDFQALNLCESHGGHEALRRWASEVAPAGSGIAWWETAAGAGSSLAVHALIAAAADPHLQAVDPYDLDGAYFPWIGALHSLLDSLVDRAEDFKGGRRSLLDYYGSTSYAAIQLAGLTISARGATERLSRPHTHRVILIAMCSYYLSAPECYTPEGKETTDAITSVLGFPLRIAIRMFRAKRLLHSFTRRTYI
jgi:tetraprenyl-beta-curcumene synthase